MQKSIYSTLRHLRHSNTARFLIAAPRYPLQRFQQNKNGERFAFDITGRMGMGGVLTLLVKILAYCEQANRIPVVAFTNSLYAEKEGADWFHSYFGMAEPFTTDQQTRSRLSYLKIENKHSYGAFPIQENMSLEEANRIFRKYIVLSPKIEDMALDVMRQAQVDSFDLSIHYRGTDKSLEAPEVAFSEVAEQVDSLMSSTKNINTIFLATDSAPFSLYIKDRFPNLSFVSFDLATEIDPNVPRHFSAMPPDQKALEALVNIVLLSKAPTCIRTSSYLSAWSKILNLGMKTYTLNHLHSEVPLFPEKQIWEVQDK